MWIQVVISFISVSGFAKDLPQGCFDFSRTINEPLRLVKELQLLKDGDTQSTGEVSNLPGVHWGAVRGKVSKSVDSLVRLLEDHNTTKSPKIEEMKVHEIPDEHYFGRNTVEFHLNPFPLIHIEWKEEWAYYVAQDSNHAPESAVISYQKVEGTSHIEHLCGSIVLKRITPTVTDVYQYEEVKASRRSPEDTVAGLQGTLKTLRTLK